MPENEDDPMVAFNMAPLNESIPDVTPPVPSINDDNLRNVAGPAQLTPILEMDIEFENPIVMEPVEENASVPNIQAPGAVGDVVAIQSIANANDNDEAVQPGNLDEYGLPTNRQPSGRATPLLDAAIASLGKKKSKARSKSKASYDFISITDFSLANDFHTELVFIHLTRLVCSFEIV